jgi:hypothetical protein
MLVFVPTIFNDELAWFSANTKGQYNKRLQADRMLRWRRDKIREREEKRAVSLQPAWTQEPITL